ncbi:MAG TPA: hypothetical protein VMT20_06690 [Terriglobia bacterium]|nr:hypothetical protein [Terriglobia bacterium]
MSRSKKAAKGRQKAAQSSTSLAGAVLPDGSNGSKPAAQSQKDVPRTAAAPTSGEASPIVDDALREPTAREQKRAVGLIRKQTTQALVEANRANSLKCTGPVTDVGKMNARLNGIKHGLRSLVAGLALPQLGEFSGDLDEIRNSLRKCFSPYDHFEYLLLDQMVENRWRRRRLVRAESSLLAAQRLKFELEYGQKVAGEGRSPDAIGEARTAAASGLVGLPDSSSKFNLILQCLRAAQEAVRREGFGEEGMRRLEAVYGPDPGLAGAVLLANYRQHQETGTQGVEEAAAHASSGQAFLDSLASEIACFEKLLELRETTAVSLAEADAGAQNALSGTDAQRFTRYETFLDRQFERLVKQFNEWRSSHLGATSFIYSGESEGEDAETLTEKMRTAAIARDKALTRAVKAAWGNDFVGGPPGSEGQSKRDRPKEKP